MTSETFRRRTLARGALMLGLCAASIALTFAWSFAAKRARTQARERWPGLPALAAHLPAADVAFTGGARWLRAPSLEEPGAAQADGIAFPDPEPGGGALVPPRAAWAEKSR